MTAKNENNCDSLKNNWVKSWCFFVEFSLKQIGILKEVIRDKKKRNWAENWQNWIKKKKVWRV
ncbi:MAG: hypothetical protein WCL14_08315 [Bacteroidota bacterium]